MKMIDVVEAYLAEGTVTTARGKRYVRGSVARLSAHLGRDATIGDLTIDTLRGWLADRAKMAGFSAVREDAKKALMLWRWCSAHGLVAETLATPRHVLPAEMTRYRPEGPPKKLPPKLRKAAGSPHREAPKRPDRGWRGLLGLSG